MRGGWKKGNWTVGLDTMGSEVCTVANETGLTPRQLADQRVQLLAALLYIAETSDDAHIVRKADAAIAKAKGAS